MMLQETSKSGKEAEGADLFFSAILYILPRTRNNTNLKSNMVYIRCFRVDLQGQEDYYITALESAIEFYLNVNEQNLVLDDQELQVFNQIMSSTSVTPQSLLESVDLLGVAQHDNAGGLMPAMTDTDEVQ